MKLRTTPCLRRLIGQPPAAAVRILLVVTMSLAGTAACGISPAPIVPSAAGSHTPAAGGIPPATEATRQVASGESVRAAVARVFEGTVSLMMAEEDALLGDFNADGSGDLAVIVRPTDEGARVLNGELAVWLVRDALTPTPAGSSPPRITVDRDDVLLAVIHGAGDLGWRDPEARQAHLLRRAVGYGLHVRPARETRFAPASGEPRGQVLAQRLEGSHGFLAWTGSRYLWREL